jgi:hypothetical protein
MRFRAEHHVGAPVADVADRIADPDFHLHLELPDLALPTLLDEVRDPEGVLLRLRYEFTGSLDPIVRRLIGAERPAWVQEIQVDLRTDTGAIRFEAERQPRLLRGSASFVLADDGSGGTVRTLEGELVVGVPGMGRMAERRLIPGIVSRMDEEARALDADLAT